MVEKSIQISMLLEIYGKLLTPKQLDLMNLYYNQNLSLSEIAEELMITRQGVRKTLVEAEKKLFDYEEKLQLWKQKQEREAIVEQLLRETEDARWKEMLQKL